MRCISSRTVFLGIVMCGTFLAHGIVIGVAGAEQRTTLSTVVGRLLKLKKNQPVGQEVEPSSEETAASQPRPERPDRPQSRTAPTEPPPRASNFAPAEPPPRASNFTPAARLHQAKTNSLPYPPFPPAVDRAWVHPPKPQTERAYTAEEVLALTRRNGLAASSRRGFQTPAAPASILKELDFDPANSPAFAEATTPVSADPPVNNVRQVNLVTELAEPPILGLPIDDAPSEAAPVGNRPAEVRQPAPAEPDEIEPALSAQPMEIAPIPLEESPAKPAFPPVFRKVRGRIAEIDDGTGVIRIDLSDNESLPAGARIQVDHKTESGDSVVVHLRVLDSVAGVAAGKLVAGAALDSIAVGDRTVAWMTDGGQ